MSKENFTRVYRVFGVILSIAVLAAGICLICGCLSIYLGDNGYSRQTVAETFSKIAVPLYVCTALSVIGFVLELTVPSVSTAQKNTNDRKHILNRLAAKKDLSKCDKTLLDSISKERKERKNRSLILTLLMCVASVFFLAYALNGNNYDSDINKSVIKAMCVLIPCLAVPFGFAIFTVFYNGKSLQREIEMLKQVPSAEKTVSNGNAKASGGEKKLSTLRFALLIIGISISVYGFVSGGTADVLAKAINICTECIGLG